MDILSIAVLVSQPVVTQHMHMQTQVLALVHRIIVTIVIAALQQIITHAMLTFLVGVAALADTLIMAIAASHSNI